MAQSGNVTQLLQAWHAGDEAAFATLVPLVYGELRKIAGAAMRQERPDHTLQASALLNEAYVRLIDDGDVAWQNKAQFLAVAALTMRRVLVDHARKHGSAKRGGLARKVELDEAVLIGGELDIDVIALDDALEKLAKIAPRKVRIVELRYFGGLSVEEVAKVLDVSEITVMREWRAAKAWLLRALDETVH